MNIIQYIWQLPQNLIGLLVVFFSKAKKNEDGVYVSESLFRSGVSLGSYIVFEDKCFNDIDIKHEKGHCKQSLYLGPLYLILIGLPSLIGNLLHRVINFSYYEQPWEKWADKLGGVER